MNLFFITGFLITWFAEDQDKGLLVRIEPLFSKERRYEDRFWIKVIYKNISGDELILGGYPNWDACVDMRVSKRQMDIVILNEKGRNIRFVPVHINVSGLGKFGKEEPPEGWSRERLMNIRYHITLMPGDSVVKFLNLYEFTGAQKPGSLLTFDELKIDYTWYYGEWTGFWNGRIEIGNIGYQFKLEKEKLELYSPLQEAVRCKKIKTLAEAEAELIKLLKKDPNAPAVFMGMVAAADAYVYEKNIPSDDSLRSQKEAIARADAIEFLIQDLKAKGYDSEFFRADYWLWLYHYRRTHIGKLGGEK